MVPGTDIGMLFDHLSRRRRERSYFMNHNQSAAPMAVVMVEIPSDIAISFAHSQYDTNANFQSAPCSLRGVAFVIQEATA
jgi:hypothetical protein